MGIIITDKSADYQLGMEDLLGATHLHLDGDGEAILALMREQAGALALPWRMDQVDQALAGVQRRIFPEIYDDHTPMAASGSEAFGAFSTCCFRETQEIEPAYRWFQEKLQALRGALSMELERVVGLLDRDEEQWQDRELADKRITYEIHHMADIKRPIGSFSLVDFRDEMMRGGVVLGGVFSFHATPDGLSLSTNAFFPGPKIKEVARHGHGVMREVLEQCFELQQAQYVPTTLIERVLKLYRA